MAINLKILKPDENKPYLIVSWNVDGYRSEIHRWLLELVGISRPDVIFLSETKKPQPELAKLFDEFKDYNYIINVHEPWRWHGVAMLIRKDHIFKQYPINMNIPVRNDSKESEASMGRVILINLNDEIYVVGSYTPNGGRSDATKLQYRTMIWDPAFIQLLELLRKNGPTIWIGDINVAMDDIDVSNPKSMSKYAGFTKEERNNLKLLLGKGEWIDIWRHQHPNDRMYTWRGYPCRNGYGMRLDNIIISESLLSQALNTFMLTESPEIADHIPICAYIGRK